MYNLLKVLNKNEPLEDLNHIDDVYENQAEMIEEIIFFNKIRIKKGNNNVRKSNKDEIKNSARKLSDDIKQDSGTQYKSNLQPTQEEDEEEEEEEINHLEYINNLKKTAF